MTGEKDLSDQDYRALAEFRFELRRFLDFSKQRAREAGLQPAQHQALLAIRGSPEGRLSVGELGRVMLLKAHSASELASRLEQAGLLERRGTVDGRERMLSITSKGMDCLKNLSRAHRDEVNRIGPLLSDLFSRIGKPNSS